MFDAPLDPFANDPDDPARELAALDDDSEQLSDHEREHLLDDLTDLEVFQSVLGPRGVRGLVVDCADCETEHYFDWDLLTANLRHLLDSGSVRVHEPAHAPDPDDYVTWDYARGYVDAVLDSDPGDDLP